MGNCLDKASSTAWTDDGTQGSEPAHLCWPCIRAYILEAWLIDKLRLQLVNTETRALQLLALMATDKAGEEEYAHMNPERFRRICHRGEFTGFAEEVARRLGLDVPWQSESSDSEQGAGKADCKADGISLGTYVLGHARS